MAMNRAFGYLISGLLLLSTIQSCKRQDLCNPYSQNENSSIHLSVDWSESGIEVDDINNLSIYAYPESGGDPYLKVSGDVESAYLNLPVGLYTLLVFNDIVGDLSGLYFQSIESYDEARIEMIEQQKRDDFYYDLLENQIFVEPQTPLAAWRMESFEVTPEMVSCGYCGEEKGDVEVDLDVVPNQVTTPCKVIIGVENLNNAHFIQCVMSGFAQGIYLENEERITNSEVDNLYGINFVKGHFDPSSETDGEVEATLTTFGKSPLEDQKYELVIDVILNSGELLTFTRDVTDQVKAQDNSEIVIDLTSDDDKITLPDGQGMGFGVDEWGDRESVDLL